MNRKNLIFVITSFFLGGALFMGCAPLPAIPGQIVPKESAAKIVDFNNVAVFTFDGVKPNPFYLDKKWVINPGTHTVECAYYGIGPTTSDGFQSQYTTYTAKIHQKVTFIAVPHHSYTLLAGSLMDGYFYFIADNTVGLIVANAFDFKAAFEYLPQPQNLSPFKRINHPLNVDVEDSYFGKNHLFYFGILNTFFNDFDHVNVVNELDTIMNIPVFKTPQKSSIFSNVVYSSFKNPNKIDLKIHLHHSPVNVKLDRWDIKAEWELSAKGKLIMTDKFEVKDKTLVDSYSAILEKIHSDFDNSVILKLAPPPPPQREY